MRALNASLFLLATDRCTAKGLSVLHRLSREEIGIGNVCAMDGTKPHSAAASSGCRSTEKGRSRGSEVVGGGGSDVRVMCIW